MSARKDTRTNRESKVIRVDKNILESLRDYRDKFGSWNQVLKNFVRESNAKVMWALPSDIYNTKPQASGEALKRVVKDGREKETPIKIRPLDG